MCRTQSGGGSAMNTAAFSQLPLSLPLLAIVLQGAAAGALVGSAVLCRARRRGLQVEPWAITAAWSTLGACLAVIYVILVLAL